jgi:UDP-N-acetylmuramate: L-alanyl-gamma-D-glutamyl-meso-diaminopimelate ligase
VRASVDAVKSLYPDKKVFAMLELHTFSSLNREFIAQYKNSLDAADIAIVYVDPHTIETKGAGFINEAFILNAFGNAKIIFLNDPDMLHSHLHHATETADVLLIMSSGNLGGMDLGKLG